MSGATGTSYEYTYDNNGNIKTVKDNNTNVTTTYTYDALNRLTKSVTPTKTVEYFYDNGSNIDYKEITENGTTRTVDYDYQSSGWKDLLMEYDGKEMEYDAIGNPTKYKDIELSWNGRQLMTYGTNASYIYNAEGIRKSKTVNGSTTTFNLVGSTILSQTKNGQTLVFLYDGNGSLIGFKDRATNKDYFYLKNLQGDIVKIIDENKAVVATYQYDDWGKLTTAESSLTAIGQLNPFRYRGYYYDDESGFYYLNSRYYDPETGRFINADAYVSTEQGLIGNNMFAYCNNNPIDRVDSNGEFWTTAVVSGLVGGFFNAMSAIVAGGDVVDVGISFSIGVVNGVVGNALEAGAFLTGAIGVVNSVSVQLLTTGKIDFVTTAVAFGSYFVGAGTFGFLSRNLNEGVKEAFNVFSDMMVNTFAFSNDLVQTHIRNTSNDYVNFYKDNCVTNMNGPTNLGWNRWA